MDGERGLEHGVEGWATKDRRYESKLSREMLKGSFSLNKERWWVDEAVERLDLACQKVGFSCGGEGWRTCQWRAPAR